MKLPCPKCGCPVMVLSLTDNTYRCTRAACGGVVPAEDLQQRQPPNFPPAYQPAAYRKSRDLPVNAPPISSGEELTVSFGSTTGTFTLDNAVFETSNDYTFTSVVVYDDPGVTTTVTDNTEAPPEAEPMFCPRCGAQLVVPDQLEGLGFCGRCVEYVLRDDNEHYVYAPPRSTCPSCGVPYVVDMGDVRGRRASRCLRRGCGYGRWVSRRSEQPMAPVETRVRRRFAFPAKGEA